MGNKSQRKNTFFESNYRQSKNVGQAREPAKKDKKEIHIPFYIEHN